MHLVYFSCKCMPDMNGAHDTSSEREEGFRSLFYLLYYHAILGRDLIHFVIRFLCLRTCPWLLTIIRSFAPNCTAVPHAISFHFRKCGERVVLIVMKTNMPRKYVALYSDHIDRDCKDWMFFTCSRC